MSVTMFSYLRFRNILTSLKVVFLTMSSSSVSLNFLMATKYDPNILRKQLTDLIGFFVSGLVYNTVGTLANDAFDFILVHTI
jgi:hypothetical protein